jgi:tetratricopeptide (TPR) repeat protein
VLVFAGWSLAYVCEHVDEGGDLVRLSLEHDPNSFIGWNSLGWISLFVGDAKALDYFHRAVRLNPLHPFLFGVHNGMAIAHFQKGEYQQAIELSARVYAAQPRLVQSLCVNASALALTGRQAEARTICDVIRGIDPPIRLSNLRRFFGVTREEILDDLKKGLRLAGLPE